mgnify:CR=1 FL=1
MPARSEHWLCGMVLLLLPALASAAAPAWPTAKAIEQAQQRHRFPDLQRLDQVPLPGLPRITPDRPAIDLEALARQHAATPNQNPDASRDAPALHIFVTLAMPEASLRLLVDQAQRSGATLLLRGLKDRSMKQTLANVQALIGTSKVAWQIDPEAYTRYGIRHAPTFVLTRATVDRETSPGTCAGHCVATTAYFSVAGDVSLDYALDTIVRRHPDAGQVAAPFLQRLRTTP